MFGHLVPSDKPHQILVVLPVITDNCGNGSLLKKGSATKLPLMLINMQLSHLLRIACLRLQNLVGKPRSENDLVDQLTYAEFGSFNSGLRIQVSLSDLPL